MPRNSRLRDYLMRRDERNPYGSRGGYITSRDPRRMRMDRGMEDMARGRNDYAERGGRMDYGYHAEPHYPMGDMGYEQRGQSRYDGHYPMSEGKTYYPIEAMGTFNGYWGTPQQDYARGDYNQDMNYDYARRGGRRDYGYDMGYDMRGRYDYGYDMAGDMGENLTKEELEHWRKKLDSEVGDEQAKNFFKKENIEQKARTMGIEMKGFNADELALASYMLYSDYCASMKPFVGSNMDVFIKMGKEFLVDPDSAVKGGEKLALYHEIVSGEND